MRMRERRPSPWRTLLIIASASVLLLVLLLILFLATSGPEDGVNWGAAFVAFALMSIGWPWSTLIEGMISPYSSTPVYVFLISLPATINVAILWGIYHAAQLVAARRGRSLG